MPLSRRLSALRSTAVAVLICLGLCSTPAHAINKDMVQLQTQIQQLQDAVARLQQSNDERMGVLRDLVQQTVDSVNKMSGTVSGLQQKLGAQAEATGQKSDQLSGQVQALNDSVDELKARLQRMEKQLGDVQSQTAQTNAALSNLPAGAGAGQPAPSGPMTNPPAGQPAQPQPPSADNGPFSSPNPAPKVRGTAANGPPVADMYRTALGDYMQAKYPLATGEFQDLIKAYPDDNLSGNAFFYLGEIDSRSAKPAAAVKNYDQVLERYPDNAKIPAAHLHKAEAMMAMKQNDAAARELRSLVQRFPNSPEAAQAKTKLATLNARR